MHMDFLFSVSFYDKSRKLYHKPDTGCNCDSNCMRAGGGGGSEEKDSDCGVVGGYRGIVRGNHSCIAHKYKRKH